MNSAIGSALWAQLKGGTALTTLLSGGTASIYIDHAPFDAALPYVLLAQQAGTWQMTQGGTRVTETVWQVKAVSGSAWPQEGELIDAQIDARLHNATLTVTGYGVLACLREGDVRYSETEGDETFQHIGALYRVTLQKT